MECFVLLANGEILNYREPVRMLRWRLDRIFLVACSLLLASVGCRSVLGIDDLPPGQAPDDGDGGEPSDAGGAEHDAPADAPDVRRIDPAWAAWQVPLDLPNQFVVEAGLARDTVTGLVWQRGTGTPKSWQEANDDCAALSLADRKDWRLPTRIELVSIMDFHLPSDGNPFPGYFLDPDWNCYWTVSREPDEISHWILVAVNGQMVMSTRDDYRCVSRCVSGAQPYDFRVNTPPAYRIEGGTIVDPLTALEWEAYQSGSAGKLVAFEEAESRCTALRLGEHDEWRLPTIKELETLIDERRILPALAPGVAGESAPYWSSTLHDPPKADAGRFAWRVSFVDGTRIPADDPDFDPLRGLVRCVRRFRDGK